MKLIDQVNARMRQMHDADGIDFQEIVRDIAREYDALRLELVSLVEGFPTERPK